MVNSNRNAGYQGFVKRGLYASKKRNADDSSPAGDSRDSTDVPNPGIKSNTMIKTVAKRLQEAINERKKQLRSSRRIGSDNISIQSIVGQLKQAINKRRRELGL